MLQSIINLWDRIVVAVKEWAVEWGIGTVGVVHLVDEINVESGNVLVLRADQIDRRAQRELTIRIMQEYSNRGLDVLVVPKDHEGFNLDHLRGSGEARELLNAVHEYRKKMKTPGNTEEQRKDSQDVDESNFMGTSSGRFSSDSKNKSNVVNFPKSEGSESSE